MNKVNHEREGLILPEVTAKRYNPLNSYLFWKQTQVKRGLSLFLQLSGFQAVLQVHFPLCLHFLLLKALSSRQHQD